MTVTKDQADTLAALAVAIRAEAGAGRWDRPGIVHAIGNVRHRPLADVMLAVAKAADDANLETPGAIGNPTASCWDERRIGRSAFEPYDRATCCDVCSKPAHRHGPHDQHPFESVNDANRRRAHEDTKQPIRELLPTPDTEETAP